MTLHRRDPPYLGRYIINLKLRDLGRLELTVSRGLFGRLCRQLYRKVSKQASMQVSGSNQVRRLIVFSDMSWSSI